MRTMPLNAREFCLWMLGGFELGEARKLNDAKIEAIQKRMPSLGTDSDAESLAVCNWLIGALEVLAELPVYSSERDSIFALIRVKVARFFSLDAAESSVELGSAILMIRVTCKCGAKLAKLERERESGASGEEVTTVVCDKCSTGYEVATVTKSTVTQCLLSGEV